MAIQNTSAEPLEEVAPQPTDTAETPTQEDVDSDSDRSGVEGIEVIVVEAQRRSEDLQTIPESISSFSSIDLQEQGLQSFNDLQFSVPNLFSGAGGIAQITLRGVGSEIVGPGIDPGFAVHVNNVFSARESTGRLDFFDIERVDVLRGPQGTLWGRNSTGGALNIITKRPVHDFDMNADIEYGTFRYGGNATRTRGVLNMPLVQDEVALRVAFITYFNSGTSLNESEDRDQRINDAGNVSIRPSLRWEPRDDVTIDLIGSYYRSSGAGSSPKFEGEFVSAPTGTPFVFDPSIGIAPGLNYDGALPNPKNPYRGTADERQSSESTVYSVTLLAAWESRDFKVDSITGFQSTDFTLHRDADGSSLAISTLDVTDKSRQISQEFLINSTWDRIFNYTFGAIYQYDWTPTTELFIPNAQNSEVSEDLVIFSTAFGLVNFVDGCQPVCLPTKPIGERVDDFILASTKVRNHVLGIYGNLSWEIIDDLTLSAGGRFSYTDRDWNDSTRVQSFVKPTGITLHVLQLGLPQHRSWQSGTWKLSAEYQATPDHLLWSSVGTGSRAGGFNFADEQHFDAERIFAVETGIKSLYFENRLMLNVTGFWYDWDDPQIRSREDSIPITANAPSAESYGVEFEFRALPIAGLALNGSFGWAEATYDKTFLAIDGTLPDFKTAPPNQYTVIDIKGNRLPRSPRFTAAFGAQYTQYIGDFGSLTPRIDFYYRHHYSFRQYNNPADVQPSYTRTDVRLTWLSDTEQFSLEFFARNLENEAVKTNQELVASIYRQHYYDVPRSFGFRLGYNY